MTMLNNVSQRVQQPSGEMEASTSNSKSVKDTIKYVLRKSIKRTKNIKDKKQTKKQSKQITFK